MPPRLARYPWATCTPWRAAPIAGVSRFRDDGTLPAKGVVPTLIEWDVPQHPAESLPKSNVSIAGMAASHPEPALIRSALASLGQDLVLPVTYDRDARLAAMLRTPRGIVTL